MNNGLLDALNVQTAVIVHEENGDLPQEVAVPGEPIQYPFLALVVRDRVHAEHADVLG